MWKIKTIQCKIVHPGALCTKYLRSTAKRLSYDQPQQRSGHGSKPLVTLAGSYSKGFKSLTATLVVLDPYGPMHIVLPGQQKTTLFWPFPC